MNIKGIYGDESHLFNPEQWVNVYVNQCDRAIYWGSMQVQDLKYHDDHEEFLLEPTTEDGEIMSIAEAKQCCQ
jgi:hypothetical protein